MKKMWINKAVIRRALASNAGLGNNARRSDNDLLIQQQFNMVTPLVLSQR